MQLFMVLEKLEDIVNWVIKEDKKLLIIAWPSSSWKSYIAKQIKNLLENNYNKKIILISTDDYYKDNTLIYYLLYGSYDHPNLVNFWLLNRHLDSLLTRKAIYKPVYSFKDKMIVNWEKIEPTYDLIIVEGLYTLNFLRKNFLKNALKLYIKVDKKELILRRIIRDPERTKEPLDRILNSLLSVFPMRNIYWENQKYKADNIFVNNYQIIKDKWKAFKLTKKININKSLIDKSETSNVIDYYYFSSEDSNNHFLIVREIYKKWFFRGVSIIKEYLEWDIVKIYEIFINQPWFLKEAHILMQIAGLKYKFYKKWTLKIYQLKDWERKVIIYKNRKEKKFLEEL